jgi:hypothetical protein
VTAVYTSDADFLSGMGQLTGNFAVRAATGTTVVTSAVSLEYGQAVTFTATVSDETLGAGTPDGMVDFSDATTGVDFGTAALVGGIATMSPSTPLGVGTHEIVATYLGDSEFFGSASAPQATVVSVDPAPTTTIATVSMPSTVFGQAVTFTATVTSALGTPVGSVDFYDLTTGTDLGTAPLSGGAATTPPITLGIGTNLIGDDVQVISWGNGSQVPTTGNSLIIAGVDNNNLLHIRIFDAAGDYTDTDETQLSGEAAAIATLKQQLPGLLAENPLSPDQQAQVLGEVRSIVGRTHLIEETYLGGGGFAGSSAQVIETVSPGASGGMVIGAPTVAGLGQAAMLSATVANVSPQSGLPMGLEPPTADVVGPIAPLTTVAATSGTATLVYTAARGRAGSTAVPLADRLHMVDHAIESDFGARGPVAIPTGPTIRARQWRARTAGAGSDRIDIGNERSGDVTDEALDRLTGSVNGKHAVDDEDINLIVAARLVRNPGPHGGRSVDGVGLEPETRRRSRALGKPLCVLG